jgi:hypothetical protein
MKAVNIKWDTDGDMELFNKLPQEIELPHELTKEEDIDYEGIYDYISDVTGFCNYGYDLDN